MIINIIMLALYFQNPIAVITAVEGGVEISTPSGQVKKANVLMALNEGDTLLVDDGNITVLYHEGKIMQYKSHSRIILNDSDTIRGAGETDVNTEEKEDSRLFSLGIGVEKTVRKVSLRAPYDSAEIYISKPGNTSIIDTRPCFAWRHYSNAVYYELQVKLKTETMLKIITVDTSAIFPENKENLLPGTYIMKILAFYNADTLAEGECIFTLLSEEFIEEINNLTREIERQDADAMTLNLLKALAFQSYKLNCEAIMNYQKVLALNPNQPIILKAIAQLYSDIGDIDNANVYFSKLKILTEPQ